MCLLFPFSLFLTLLLSPTLSLIRTSAHFKNVILYFSSATKVLPVLPFSQESSFLLRGFSYSQLHVDPGRSIGMRLPVCIFKLCTVMFAMKTKGNIDLI